MGTREPLIIKASDMAVKGKKPDEYAHASPAILSRNY